MSGGAAELPYGGVRLSIRRWTKTDSMYNVLSIRDPVEHILHVLRDLTKPGNAASRARSSAHDPAIHWFMILAKAVSLKRTCSCLMCVSCCFFFCCFVSPVLYLFERRIYRKTNRMHCSRYITWDRPWRKRTLQSSHYKRSWRTLLSLKSVFFIWQLLSAHRICKRSSATLVVLRYSFKFSFASDLKGCELVGWWRRVYSKFKEKAGQQEEWWHCTCQTCLKGGEPRKK